MEHDYMVFKWVEADISYRSYRSSSTPLNTKFSQVSGLGENCFPLMGHLPSTGQ